MTIIYKNNGIHPFAPKTELTKYESLKQNTRDAALGSDSAKSSRQLFLHYHAHLLQKIIHK